LPIVVSGILLCTSGKLVKNNMEVVRAIFSVGIIFSLIVYESGSIWSSAIVHGIWNVIIIGEILNINILYNQHAIFSYKLLSKSFILTGGAFGVESSIVAVLGYITVIIFTLFSMKRKFKNT